MGSQRGQLDSRLGELANQLATGDEDPATALEQQRQAVLEQRVVAERALGTARAALEGIDNVLREFEQTRHQRDEQSLAQRETISQRKLHQQALVIHAEQLATQVHEAGFVLTDVIAGPSADAEGSAWPKRGRAAGRARGWPY